MAAKTRILTLNNIAKVGLVRLPEAHYEVGSKVADPDGILVRSHDMHSFDIGPRVQAIARAGAGTNNIPVKAMSARGVPVFNAPGANANAVKELVIAGMLMAARNLPAAMRFVDGLNGDDDTLNKLVEDAEKYGSVTKKTRTPRKPRAVSVEKKLKHLKYQKEDNTLKIASINPEKILGAQELWTFNTKYKVVTVFRAIDRGGLQINRSSITGFDEKASESKGCGRKPEIVLDKLQNGGKIVLKKLMSELKTDKPLQVRINENTILMKVM